MFQNLFKKLSAFIEYPIQIYFKISIENFISIYKYKKYNKSQMLFAFFAFAFCNKLQRPIFCIHGLGGVQTDAEITAPISKCPTDKTRIGVWAPDDELKETNPDCIAYFLEAKLDSNNKVVPNPNFEYVIPPFGSLETINAFRELKPYLENRGYTYKKDLFGVTFNWILYPLGTPELFTTLKKYIEDVHKESGMKVVILAHSLGTHVLRTFITREMTKEWVQEHIDGVIFNAPAFFGCFGTFDYIVNGQFSSLKKTEYNAYVTQKMPSLHAMFDNYVVFKDTVVFANVTGYGDVTAPNVRDFLIQKGMMHEEAQKIFAQIEDSLKEAPPQPPVRSLILYNSGLDTVVGYKGDNYEKIYGGGDSVCNSASPDYVCKVWNNIECKDWNKNDAVLWSHTPMLHRPEALDKIYEFLTANNNEKSNDNNNILKYSLIAVCSVAGVLVIVLIVLLVLKRKKEKNNPVNSSLI